MDILNLDTRKKYLALFTKQTLETPKYPRWGPRDRYTAPNSKYIGAECPPPPPPEKKELHPSNQPGEVSNNKYM